MKGDARKRVHEEGSNPFRSRSRREGDQQWIAALIRREWGSSKVVSRGRIHDVPELEGFVAEEEGEAVGLLSYRVERDECEIVTLNSLAEGAGIGTMLLRRVVELAMAEGCRRVWLITTNDNMPALRFYQKRGFCLVKVYPGALDESRRLKPEIPAIGWGGIPLRDEIELELVLAGG